MFWRAKMNDLEGVVTCVVGCHWDKEGNHTDDIRMNQLSKLTTPAALYGVTKSRKDDACNVQGDIQHKHTWKEIAAKRTVLLILDYMWLQKGWLTHAQGYGDMWIALMRYLFINGGLVAIIPNDVNEEMQCQVDTIDGGDMIGVKKLTYCDALHIHPLWIATHMARESILCCKYPYLRNKVNESSHRYLNAKYPFFLFFNMRDFKNAEHATTWISRNVLHSRSDTISDTSDTISDTSDMISDTMSYTSDTMSCTSATMSDTISDKSDAILETPETISETPETISKTSDVGDCPLNHMCTVKASSIPKAGRGLFARQFIKRGSILGKYSGVLLCEHEYNRRRHKDYMFQISSKKQPLHYIDGTSGNILSMMNGAKGNQMHLVNIYTYQWRKSIYFKALKDIEPGQELLQCYGSSYW